MGRTWSLKTGASEKPGPGASRCEGRRYPRGVEGDTGVGKGGRDRVGGNESRKEWRGVKARRE